MTMDEDWDSAESNLFDAVQSRDIERLKEVLRQNPDIDINEERNGKSALHIAVENGQGDMVRLLVTCGADIYIENSSKSTPVDVARSLDFHEISKFLSMIEMTAWRPGMDPDLLLTPICREYIEPKAKSNLVLEQSQISLLLQDQGLDKYHEYFERHNITFIQFMRLDDDCLQKIGITDTTDRENILKIIKEVSERNWQPGSVLPNFMERNLTSSETICMLNNLQSHTQIMCSTVNLLKTKIMNKPNMLRHNMESASMKGLITSIDKTTNEAENLSQNVKLLVDSVSSDNQNDDMTKQSSQYSSFKYSMISIVLFVTLGAFVYHAKKQ